MRSKTVFTAGLTVATLAFGVPQAERAQERAVPGEQHSEVDLGFVNGTVEGATGYVITLDVGRQEPLVQVIVKDEDALSIRQEGRDAPLALSELEEGMPVRTYFRTEGDVRVATFIEVLEPSDGQ